MQINGFLACDLVTNTVFAGLYPREPVGISDSDISPVYTCYRFLLKPGMSSHELYKGLVEAISNLALRAQ